MSKMELEKSLVRFSLSALYLISTISNIFLVKSLGASRMDMNGWVIDLSAKYPLRVLPFLPMCRCASGILDPISTSS